MKETMRDERNNLEVRTRGDMVSHDVLLIGFFFLL